MDVDVDVDVRRVAATVVHMRLIISLASVMSVCTCYTAWDASVRLESGRIEMHGYEDEDEDEK